MQLTRLLLHNVRCFDRIDLEITAPRVIIEGPNGAGKSSLVEALHYCCYLRSFRMGRAAEIAREDGDGSFFIKVAGLCNNNEAFTLQVGFNEKKKLVKVNDNTVHTYKEVMRYYRVVTIAEHDLALIQAGPEARRSFINHYSLLLQPEHADLLRRHKNVADQRTQLLINRGSDSELATWSEQLWDLAHAITKIRIDNLAHLEQRVNQLAHKLSPAYQKTIGLSYRPKNRRSEQTFFDFWTQYQATTQKERLMRRNLFGAHLDDIAITMDGRSMRTFASRGQQKLVLLLLTLAQVSVLQELHPDAGILLVLDDFITDFDATVLQEVLSLINDLSCGVIITSPLAQLVSLPEPVQVISL